VFYGWWIVLAAMGITTFGSGVWAYGFPVFFSALLTEFGWSRAMASGAFALSRLEGGIEAPLVGWLADKYGPRKLAIAGAIIASVGFIAMSQVNSFTIGSLYVSALVVFYVLYLTVLAVGYNTGFTHATMVAVNAWFERKRSRAFAIFSTGGALSGPVVAVVAWVVATYGWRSASVLVGISLLIIVLPLAFVLRHKPEQYGYLPDGEAPESRDTGIANGADGPLGTRLRMAGSDEVHKGAPAGQIIGEGFSVKESMRTAAFWLLIAGSSARSIAMTAVILHLPRYLEDTGMPLQQAGAVLGMMVTLSIVGRIGMGWAGDYVEKRYLLVLACLLQAAGIFILQRVSGMTEVWVFALVYSLGYGGAIPVHMALVGDYFGRRYYATIRGFLQLFVVPATMIGPIYAGWVFDVTGSYQIAFTSFIFALVIGSVFFFFARRPAVAQRPSYGPH